MIEFPGKVRSMRTAVVSFAAMGLACLTGAFFAQVTQAENSRPIDVFVSWSDSETAILALRSPAPSKRIVVGIARPMETDDSNSSHLFQIPGFREAIPTISDLAAFRAGLSAGEGVSGKYAVHTYPFGGGVKFSFAEIEPGFLQYLHSENKLANDLQIWEVTSPSSAQTVRIAFLGDLVFVNPPVLKDPLSNTEQTIVRLLGNLAMAEGQGLRQLTLQGECVRAWANIEGVWQSPVSVEERKNLLNDRAGKLIGGDFEENEYRMANAGWVNRSLHLEVHPPPGDDFQVTSIIGGQEEIIGSEKNLELPPCTVANVSIASQWYDVFPEPVKFSYNDAKLRADVPGPRLRWERIIGGSVFMATAFMLGILFKRRRKPPSQNIAGWKEKIEKGRQVPPQTKMKLFSEKESPAKGGWWMRGKASNRPERPTPSEVPFVQSMPPQPSPRKTAPPLPVTDPLKKLLLQYRETSDRQQALHASAVEHIEARLSHLQGDTGAHRELDSQKIKLDMLQGELKRWQQALKHIGDSPEAVYRNYQTLKQQHRDFEKRVLDLHPLWAGANRHVDGPTVEIGQALDQLHQILLSTKQSKDEYEVAAMRILDVRDPSKTDEDVLNEPDRLATQVEQLRGFTDRVLQKYSEPVQLGTEANNFNLKPVADLEKRFADMVKTCEALAGLGADERVYRARIISRGLECAGQALSDLAKENAEYADLFVGTRMELGALARQLLSTSKSSEITLTTELSRQVTRINNEVPKRENVEQVLIHYVEHLLRNAPYMAILNMLRLWQVTEVYCRDSSDPVAASFFEGSLAFRTACVRVLSDFTGLGVHFHPIRFLKDPKEEGLVFTDVAGVPPVQSNAKLIDPMLKMMSFNFAQFENTVADVNAWGFDCELDPGLDCKTSLWLWR